MRDGEEERERKGRIKAEREEGMERIRDREE